eukprot:3481-Heterococcus_DN1.PRE.1
MVARQLRHEAAVARRAAAVDGAAAATTATVSSSDDDSDDDYSGSNECDSSSDNDATAADDAEAAWLKEVSVIIDGADLLRAQSMQRSGSAAGLNVQSPLETAVLHFDLLAFNSQPRPPKALVVLPQTVPNTEFCEPPSSCTNVLAVCNASLSRRELVCARDVLLLAPTASALMPDTEASASSSSSSSSSTDILVRLQAQGRLIAMDSWVQGDDGETGWLADYACSVGNSTLIVTNRQLSCAAVYLQILRGTCKGDIYSRLVRYAVSGSKFIVAD